MRVPGKLLTESTADATLYDRARRSIMGLIAAQIGAVIVAASLLAVLSGPTLTYSVLVGGLIGIAPNYYFACRMMRRRTSATAEQSLRQIYAGEFIKIAFTSALFVIAVMILNINFLVVVASYLGIILVNWLALLFVNLGELKPLPAVGSSTLNNDRKA